MLLCNATLATMASDGAYGLMHDAAVAVDGGQIAWVGASANVPEAFVKGETRDLSGRLVTPGFVDCHTHLVFAGNRAREFEQRLTGVSYEEIARSGGGIASTVSATRDASDDELLSDALVRIDQMCGEGVTAVEIKSGYGLDFDTELKMLRVAREIEKVRRIRVRTSFLGAHAVPAEFKDRPDAYIETICLPALEHAAEEGLVDAVDGFCEAIAFSPEQLEPLFRRAADLGLPMKLHAEQLSHSKGTQLVARYKGLSADHVEYANAADAAALARAGSVAVLLPGAFYTLRETQVPPIDAFRDHRVPMALATDCNPGSSPMTSLLLTMNMGCTLFQMTPQEALAGVTRNGARALGLLDCGMIAAGLRADLAVWDVEHPAELSYRIAQNLLHARMFGGSID